MLGRLLQNYGYGSDDGFGEHTSSMRGFSVPTVAGPTVDTQESMTVPAMFCAINLLGSLIGMLPRAVLQRTGEGINKRIFDHRVHRLLNQEPNPEMTSMAFNRTNFLHTMVYGNGVAPIERDGRGQIKWIWPVNPERVNVLRNRLTGVITYRIRQIDGSEKDYSMRQVLHPAGIGMDGVMGYGLVNQLARENIGEALAIAQYAQAFFGNGSMTGMSLEFDNVMGEEVLANYKRTLESQHQGPTNSFKTLIIDGGGKMTRLSADNKAADTAKLKTFAVQDIARWTGVPPPFLMELSHATYTNVDKLGLYLVKFTCTPWFKTFEQEYTRKLFSEEERKTLRVKFIAEGLLRGSSKERSEYHRTMMNLGVMSINEVRVIEKLNPLGPEGDKHYVELNRWPIEDGPPPAKQQDQTRKTRNEPTDPPPDKGKPPSNNMEAMRVQIGQAHNPLLAQTLTRMVNIQQRAAARAYKKDKDGYNAWVEKYYVEHLPMFRSAMMSPIEALGGAIRATLPRAVDDKAWDEFVGEFTRAFVEKAIEDLIGTARFGPELLASDTESVIDLCDVDAFTVEAVWRFEHDAVAGELPCIPTH